MKGVGGTLAADVSSHFTDPDGDKLEYDAHSTHPSAVKVSTSGSSVTVEWKFTIELRFTRDVWRCARSIQEPKIGYPEDLAGGARATCPLFARVRDVPDPRTGRGREGGASPFGGEAWMTVKEKGARQRGRLDPGTGPGAHACGPSGWIVAFLEHGPSK